MAEQDPSATAALLSVEQIVAGAEPLPPIRSGVYFLILKGEVVYVGMATDVVQRITAHMKEKTGKFDSFTLLPVPFSELADVEWAYIQALQPPLNGNKRNRQHGIAARVKPEWYDRVVGAGCP